MNTGTFRYLQVILYGSVIILSFVMTVRYIIKSSKYMKRLEVWKPYIEKLI